MNRQKSIIIGCVLLLLTAGFSTNAFALAFGNNNIGLRGLALNSAFTGIADDSSAVYYNPAGLTAVDDGAWDIDFSLMSVFTGYEYTNTAGTTFESNEIALIPALFASSKSGNLAYGIGLYCPYGGGSAKWEDYPIDGKSFEGTIGFIAITPSVAYEIIPLISVGLGASVYYGIFEQKAYMMGADLEASFNGIAGFGGDLGVMLRPTDELNIGIKYQTPISIGMEGDVSLTAFNNTTEESGEVEFTLPPMYIIGIAYKVTPDLIIDLDFWYEIWSEMDEIKLDSDALSITGSSKLPIETYYDDSYEIALGAEYMASKGLRINVGFKYEKQVAKDEGVSVTGNCETDRVSAALGGGYGITDNIELGGNLSYVVGLENEIKEGDYAGKYSQNHIAVILGLRGKF